LFFFLPRADFKQNLTYQTSESARLSAISVFGTSSTTFNACFQRLYWCKTLHRTNLQTDSHYATARQVRGVDQSGFATTGV
jgi:hypothetical protein